MHALIEPTITVVGNGTCTKTKVATFTYRTQGPDDPIGSNIDEACWRVNATPQGGAQFVRFDVKCVITGTDAQGNAYTNTATKSVSNPSYTSFWWEPISGESPDSSTAFWYLTTELIYSPVSIDLPGGIELFGPYTVSFDITAIFSSALTYDANGGIGAPQPQEYSPGVAFRLSTAIPTRDGYQFLGWADSSSGAAIYARGQLVTFSEGSKIIYAVWRAWTHLPVRSVLDPTKLLRNASGVLIRDD